MCKAVRAQLNLDPTEEIVWIYGTHTTEQAALNDPTAREGHLHPGPRAAAASEWRWAVVHHPEERLRNLNAGA